MNRLLTIPVQEMDPICQVLPHNDLRQPGVPFWAVLPPPAGGVQCAKSALGRIFLG